MAITYNEKLLSEIKEIQQKNTRNLKILYYLTKILTVLVAISTAIVFFRAFFWW
jgi:predicted nucleic acid-binding Zn ribbon protein